MGQVRTLRNQYVVAARRRKAGPHEVRVCDDAEPEDCDWIDDDAGEHCLTCGAERPHGKEVPRCPLMMLR